MAVLKLSQIAAAGVAPAVTDQAVFVTGGATDNLVTVTQLAAGLPTFTAALKGSVPASGGGTTNFLRADGTFAAPAGTPAGLNTQVQFNNAGAFGGITNLTSNGTNLTADRMASTASRDWDNGAGTVDLSFFRDAVNIAAIRVGTSATPMGLRIYNTAVAASEFAALDWNIQANTFTIAATQSGGGTVRNIVFSANAHIFQAPAGTTLFQVDSTPQALLQNNCPLKFAGGVETINHVAGRTLGFLADNGAGCNFRHIPDNPASLGANQNNYNPGGFSTYQRLTSSVAVVITGLTFTGGNNDGMHVVAINIGASTITLSNLNGSSSSANQFQCTSGADIILSANQQADLIYDNTTGKWRVSKMN